LPTQVPPPLYGKEVKMAVLLTIVSLGLGLVLLGLGLLVIQPPKPLKS
jgi:hypothetical protein